MIDLRYPITMRFNGEAVELFNFEMVDYWSKDDFNKYIQNKTYLG